MSLFAEKPTLTGEKVVLRPMTPECAPPPGMFDDPDTTRLTGSHGGAPAPERIAWWVATRKDHDDRLDLTIVDRASGEPAGEIVLNELDADNLQCNLRIAIGPEWTDKGLGQESIRLALAHAFETVRLNRVGLEVFAFNPRARHVYEKIGFVHEGTRRQALLWDGEWVDAHDMSILAREWPPGRGPSTERLTLRPITPDDLDNLVELDADPEVMRFLSGGKPTSRERLEHEILPRLLATRSFYAGLERESGSFIGWFCIRPKPGCGHELGYRLRREFWGKGYATEGSRALVELAFTRGADRVWAETMAVNTRSRRVLEKAGLELVRTFHLRWDAPIEGVEEGEVEYAVTRSEWSDWRRVVEHGRD